jgi:hypothetical protein
MKTLLLCCAVAGTILSGCVSETVRKNDDRYMQPGALDPNLTGYYDVYNVSFLGKYRIQHEWPLPARACKYGSMSTLGKDKDRYTGEVFWVNSIFEDAGQTWQESVMGAPRSFNPFVRSVIVKRPEYDSANGVLKTDKSRYVDREEGLEPICFEAWTGTSHAVTIFLYKRTVNEWREALARWSKGAYVSADAKQSLETVLGNTWHIYRVPLRPREINRIAGSYELRILPIADTGYSLALELGANAESLQNPQAHAAFKAMFQRLIESVKVEPLTPAIEAKMEQLKSRAFEIMRQNCISMAQRTKPPAYCQRYLKQ